MPLTPYQSPGFGTAGENGRRNFETFGGGRLQQGKVRCHSPPDAVIDGACGRALERRGLSRTQVALGWLLSKSAVPVVGVTKMHHIEQAAEAVGVCLSKDETGYLEEAYVPHRLVGVMGQNQA